MCIPQGAPAAQEITASKEIVHSPDRPPPARARAACDPRMQALQAAADLLAQRAARPPRPVEFRPFAPANSAPPCAAVDGSSAVLVDNGSAWVIAYRAASVPW